MKALKNILATALVLLGFGLYAAPAMAAPPACMSGHPTPAVCYHTSYTTQSCGTHTGLIGDPLQCPSDFFNNTVPGDTIILLKGSTTYPEWFLGAGANGTSANYIHILGNGTYPASGGPDPTNGPTMSNSSGVALFMSGVNFVDIQGINFTNTDTQDQNCIFSSTAGGIQQGIHFLHNQVYHCGQEAFNIQAMDYVTVSNNLIHDIGTNNTSVGTGGDSPSGIHPYQLTNVDTNAGYHIIINANTVWNVLKGVVASDGMDYEIDNLDGTQGGWCAAHPSGCPYSGAILISNNIGYNSDGDFLHIYTSTFAPTVVVNNTSYLNDQNQTCGNLYGDITINTGGDAGTAALSFYNNILYSKTGCNAHVITNGNNAINIDAENWFNGTSNVNNVAGTNVTTGSHNVNGNPNFSSPPTNFALTSGSAAFCAALPAFAPSTDLLGNARTGSGGCGSICVDDGAIEFH